MVFASVVLGRNAWNSWTLYLMLNDGVGVWILSFARYKNAWNLSVLYLTSTDDGIGCQISDFNT